MFFSLGEELEDDEAYCNMVKSDEDENQSMQQDSGHTETDSRRKTAKTPRSEVSEDPPPWPYEESPMVPIPVQDLRVYYVDNFNDVLPKGLMEDSLRLRSSSNL